MSNNQTESVAGSKAVVQCSNRSVPRGIHTMLELYGCPATLLNDPRFIEKAIRDAADKAGCELIQLNHHHFQPHGVTAVALLAESHMSIHTWPEHGYAAVDLFTCGESSDPQAACDLLVDRFAATGESRNALRRGGAVPA